MFLTINTINTMTKETNTISSIYYIISGHGLAGAGSDRVEVRGGHFNYIPKGVEHFLYNLSDTESIEAIGIYIGSGSVEDTGYRYLGDVTKDDLKI